MGDRERIADLERQLAEARNLFDRMAEGFAICDVVRDARGDVLDLTYVALNAAFERQAGRSRDGLIGRRLSDLFRPADMARWMPVYARVADSGEPEIFQQYMQELDRWFEVSAYARGHDQLSIFFRDATAAMEAEAALRETEKRQAFLLRLSDAIRPLSDASEIQKAACRVLGTHLQVEAAQYSELNWERRGITTSRESSRGDMPSCVGDYSTEDWPRHVEAWNAGHSLIIDDVETSSALSESERAGLLAGSVRAILSTPLVKEGTGVAAMSALHGEAHHWTAAEVASLQEAAERTWAAVERARAEAAMRASEERFRSVSESDVVAVAFFGTDGAITDANNAFLNLIGYTRGEMQAGAVRWDRLTPPEWLPQTQKAVRQYQQTGRIEPYEKEYFRRSGERFWGLFGGRRIESSGEGVAFVMDITERKRAEAVLRKNAERQAFLLRLSDAIRPLSDPLAIQETACRVLGQYLDSDWSQYSPVDIQRNILTNNRDYHRADAPSNLGEYDLAVFPVHAQAWKEGRSVAVADVETDPLLSDGERAGLRAAGVRAGLSTPLLKNGVLTAVMSALSLTPRSWNEHEAALLEEVADRTWAAVERSRAETALRESEQNLHGVANVVPDLLWYSALDGSTPWCNDRWLQYTGQTLEQARDWGWADSIHPDDRENSARRYREAVEQSKPLQQEHRIRDAAGGYRWFLVRAEPWRGADGRVTRMYGAATDIHDQRLAMEALRESEERQAFLLRLSDALRPLGNPREIQQMASRMLGERFHTSRALYAEIEGTGPTADAVINGQFVQGVAPVPDRVNYKLFTDGFPGELWRQGLPVVVEDSETDPRFIQPTREAWRTINTRASLAVPLVKDGREAVIFGLHNAEPRKWTQADVVFLTEAVERTWAATERAIAEDALRESEEKYRRLFETMDQGYEVIELVRDASNKAVDYKMVLANPAYERIVGLPAKDILNRSIVEAIPGIDPWWLETFSDIAGKKVPRRFEREEPQVGRWFELHVVPQESDRLLVLFDNITDRKRAERTLRESEERFRLYVENVREYALVQTDFEGTVTSWNPGAERLFGYTSAEIVGQAFDMLMPEEDRRDGIIAREMAALSRGKKNIEAHTVQRKDGTRFWAEWVTEPVLDDAGKLRGTAKIMRDETERQRSQQSLENSELRQRTLLEGIPQLVWRSLDEGYWTWSSPQWQQFTGRTLEQSQGEGWLDVIHPDDRSRTIAAWAEAGKRGMLDVEHRIRRAADGVYVWHQTRSVPASEAIGGVVEWLGTSTDIAAAKKADAEKEALLKEVHHRVKNNLQVITSLINLQSSQIVDEEVRSHFDETRNRIFSIASIHELLYRSASFAEIDLVGYARQLTSDLIQFHGLSDRVRAEFGAEDAFIELKRAVPFGLLLNELVSNALKHAFPGEQTGVVRITVTQGGTEILLLVEDDGIGIADTSHLEQAQTLGMRLIFALTEQLGGTISYRHGSGTIAEVRFPAHPERL